ncbi:MAG: protein translocase subunit SecF [Candidatus Zixiibacteriota bacterium]
MQFLGKTNIDFIGMRKISWAISAVLVLIGIVAFFMIVFGQTDLSIDFAGGTEIQGSFATPIEVSTVRSALGGAGFADASIQTVQGSAANSFNIRVKASSGGSETEVSVAEKLRQALDAGVPGNTFKLDSVQEVGPTIGKELQSQAQLAVVIAMIGILIYIWIRFDFRFSVAATVATFHDVLAVLGFMFVMQRELSLLIITALLTIAGYTINDKIIVFDRIRENLRLFRKKGDFVEAVNGAINQTLSRTIITAMTTFIAVVVILVVCGPVVRDFALALAFGILIGTYSSIFVASPIIVEWEARSPKRFK